MITLPAAFEAANKKKQQTPSTLVLLETSELKAEKKTETDWGNNVAENEVDYTSIPGNVILNTTLWLSGGHGGNAYIYNVERDGTLITSFLTSTYDAASTSPGGIGYGYDDTLWIIDANSNKVYNVTTAGTFISSFSVAIYNSPFGLSCDPNGTLWIVDSSTNIVYNLTTTGSVISSFSVTAGVTGLFVSPARTLWMCDKTTNTIYHRENDGTLINSFATSVFDASATSVEGIGLSNVNTLWIADSNTRKIYNVTIKGALLDSWLNTSFGPSGTLVLGLSCRPYYSLFGNITTDNLDLGSTPTVPGEWQIGDSRVAGGALWVSDESTDKIYSITTSGRLRDLFPTSVFDASATAPKGISYAPNGTLWICDSATDKIYNIEPDGTLITSFATSAFDASAILPAGISFSSDGTLWICDVITKKIYNVTTTGTLISSFLTSVFDVSATSPNGISYAPDGTLWISDIVTDKIYNVTTTGTLISSFATSVFDASATQPTSVHYAPDGTLWICDANTDKIYNVELDGTLISSFATSVFDASAVAPQGVSSFQMGSIAYEAWGSATGAFAGEETYLGVIEDGDEITQLFRYYRVKARLSSSNDRADTPRLQSIVASFVTFTKLTDTKGLGYNVTVSGVSSLTTKIDMFKSSTIGEISVDAFFNQEMSTYFSIPRKNRLVKVFQGFAGLAESDYISYYYGIIGNAPIKTDETITITIDDYTATWSKPIPAKWETVADDVEWAGVHPIDVLLDIFKNHLDVRDSFIDHAAFDTVRAAHAGWIVSRKITGNTERTDVLINELRQLMSCFLIPQPDGKVSIKQFDATAAAVASISDDDFIAAPGLSYDPQYSELINRFTTYYGWDGAGDDLENYAGLDDYTNSTSVTAWKEERFEVVKDKWTALANTSQVTARRTVLDGIYGNAPVLLTGKLSRRLVALEAGDVVEITIDRYPKASGFGITNKKFLLIKRNYNYNKGDISVSFLEL